MRNSRRIVPGIVAVALAAALAGCTSASGSISTGPADAGNGPRAPVGLVDPQA
jgi:hypothetical protein